MKRILLITDSLALPRPKPEACAYENTWPALLKNSGKYIVHQVSIGGATTTFLLKQVVYHKMFKPDVVVLQCGIVDCAPRFAKQFELELINRLPFRKFILSKLNRTSVKKFRAITYTPLNRFEQNIKKLADHFKEASMIAIGIVPGSEKYEAVLPGVCKNITAYNEVLQRNADYFIDLQQMTTTGIMSDHHHINDVGHSHIYRHLEDALKNV